MKKHQKNQFKSNKNVFRMIRYFFRCKKATIYACIMCALRLVVGIVTPICNKYIQTDIIPNKNINTVFNIINKFTFK